MAQAVNTLQDLGFARVLDGYRLNMHENIVQGEQRELKLGKLTIYLDIRHVVAPTATYNVDDPTVIDLIAYAVSANKPKILAMLARVLGAYVDTHHTGDPCSSQWSQRLVDEDGDEVEFVEKVVVWERERRKRLYQGAEKIEERLYFAVDMKGRWYLVYEEEDSGWTPGTDWRNYSAWVLPLQPMRLHVVEKGVKVRCGPDGEAREYGPKIVREYSFPPEIYER